MQEPLAALGLPSYRWAGFGGNFGQAPVALEAHLEFYKWSPLAALGPLDKPPDASLAAAVPAEPLFFAAVNAGDAESAWKRLRPWLVRIAAMDRGGREEEEDVAEKALAKLRKEFLSEFGLDLEKDLLPQLSGELGCFVSGGGEGRAAFGLLLAAKDEAAAKKLMAAMKIEDGTVGPAGGRGGHGGPQVARIGRSLLFTGDDDEAKNMLAAVAAGRTLANSAEYKKGLEALGAGQGVVLFASVGAVQKAAGGADQRWLAPLSGSCSPMAGVSLTGTGLTVRSTASLEVAPLLALLPEMERVASAMTRNACRARLENLGAAAAEFARAHGGAWPASFDQLGEGYKAGSPLRRCPADGKEYSFAALGTVPPKAQGRGFVLCHGAEGGHGEAGRAETCLLAVRYGAAYAEPLYGQPGTLAARLSADQAILAMADPKRLQLSDEEKKALAEAAAELGNENFDRREAATKRLTDLGPKAASALLGLLASKDPEVADRALTILKKLTGLNSKEEMLRLAP
jgi:hypothetical protein